MKKVIFTQKIKRAWINALRSGKYKQGTGLLYDPTTNCYCVMGVLGVICGYDKSKLSKANSFFDKKVFQKIPDIFIGASHSPTVGGKLMILNDEKEMSFKWFASYIERYL